MLHIGDKVPAFSLPDENGNMHTPSEFLGKKVILYFYPKDNTSGCTAQACAFAELYPQFREKDAVIVGISRDGAESHRKFREKFNLPFLLLSDTDHAVTELFGAWGEKKNYGKVTFGVIRSTYLIDETGTITRIMQAVKAKENPSDTLALL